MTITEEIADLVIARATVSEIRRATKSSGMKDMLE